MSSRTRGSADDEENFSQTAVHQHSCCFLISAYKLLDRNPDKTAIGRVSKGFDFLGYRLSSKEKVTVNKHTLQRCRDQWAQLQEQGADSQRLESYGRRWISWLCGYHQTPLIEPHHDIVKRLKRCFRVAIQQHCAPEFNAIIASLA